MGVNVIQSNDVFNPEGLEFGPENCFDASLDTKCMSGSLGPKYKRAFALELEGPQDIDLEVKSVSIYSPLTDARYAYPFAKPKNGYRVRNFSMTGPLLFS